MGGLLKVRSIIFRGKTMQGEWVEGFYYHDKAVDLHAILKTTQSSKPYVLLDGSKEVDHLLDMAQVIPETVGQFTGLSDKHGKRIFEGDIVRCVANYDAGNCVVIYEDGEFRLVPDRYYHSYTTGAGFHAIRCFEKEIIGNVHDTPELLENSHV